MTSCENEQLEGQQKSNVLYLMTPTCPDIDARICQEGGNRGVSVWGVGMTNNSGIQKINDSSGM